MRVLAGGTAAEMFRAVILLSLQTIFHIAIWLDFQWITLVSTGQNTTLGTKLTEQQPNLYVLVPETGYTNICFSLGKLLI